MTRFDKFNPIILTKDEAIQRIRNRFGRIYIIKAEGLNCKIGTAKDIKSRKGTLQTGNERNLEVLYQSVPMKNNYAVEMELHNKYSYCQINNEWFDINIIIESFNEIVAYIEAEADTQIELEEIRREILNSLETEYFIHKMAIEWFDKTLFQMEFSDLDFQEKKEIEDIVTKWNYIDYSEIEQEDIIRFLNGYIDSCEEICGKGSEEHTEVYESINSILASEINEKNKDLELFLLEDLSHLHYNPFNFFEDVDVKVIKYLVELFNIPYEEFLFYHITWHMDFAMYKRYEMDDIYKECKDKANQLNSVVAIGITA